MIRELGETIGDAVVESVGRAMGRAQEQRPLDADLLESDDAYLVVFDAPGAEADDVQVSFEGDAVHVRVDRFREFHEGYDMRFPGRGLSLDGSVTLPEGAAVDAGEATATLTDNGTLQIRLPKAEDDESTVETPGAADGPDEAPDEEPDPDGADRAADDAPAEGIDESDGESRADDGGGEGSRTDRDGDA